MWGDTGNIDLLHISVVNVLVCIYGIYGMANWATDCILRQYNWTGDSVALMYVHLVLYVYCVCELFLQWWQLNLSQWQVTLCPLSLPDQQPQLLQLQSRKWLHLLWPPHCQKWTFQLQRKVGGGVTGTGWRLTLTAVTGTGWQLILTAVTGTGWRLPLTADWQRLAVNINSCDWQRLAVNSNRVSSYARIQLKTVYYYFHVVHPIVMKIHNVSDNRQSLLTLFLCNV